MKHLIVILVAILTALVAIALLFTSVRAAGVNLSWDDCGSHGVELRTFACNTNAGLNTIVGSFVMPAGVDSISGNEIVIDLQSAGSALPAWWQMQSGLCRAGALGGDFDFTGGPFSCYDYWQGGAVGVIAMDPPFGNRARIEATVSLPPGDPRITPIAEGTEVYSFKANIRNTKTTGLGACAGCEVGVCIWLSAIKLVQPMPLPAIILSNPDTRAGITWQCGFFSTKGCVFTQDCITPAQSSTWGQIKQLYR